MQQPLSPITSHAVDFFEVHRMVVPILSTIESWPVAGTLEWQGLADTDPAKWAAVLDIAQYGVLTLQLRQELIADAGKNIATGLHVEGQLTAIARHLVQGRGPAYVPRKAAS